MMAAWGSGGALDFFAADSQVELQAALAQVFERTEATAGPAPTRAMSAPTGPAT